MAVVTETWASGDAYEPFVGRWSRLIAAPFLRWLAVEPRRRWLDVGCGTGALTVGILDGCDPLAVTGIDPSADYIAWSRSHVDDHRATFEVRGVDRLPASTVDVVVSGLVLNFLPDPAAALSAMRAAAPTGMVGAYVWDYRGRMEMLRYFWDAAAAQDPAAKKLAESDRFAWCRPEPLEALWRAAGFADVQTSALDVPTRFADFDDYWRPFLGGQGPAAGYLTSLDDDRRTGLRNRLRSALPTAIDGSITLTARAWSVKGRSA